MDDSTLFGIIPFLAIIASILAIAFFVLFIDRKKNHIHTHADATLYIYSGTTLIQQVPLSHTKAMTIGRDGTDILLADYDHISRQHARIFFDQHTWILEDNNSRNGTFVNYRPIVRRPIQSNDVIHIGPLAMYLDIPEISSYGRNATEPRAVSSGQQTYQISAPSGKTHMFGHFELIQQLGSGGIARVWLARDTNNGYLIALKQLMERDELLTEKFIQEGGLRLNHPHIAQVFEANQIDGQPYIAMEYIHGPTLTQIMPHHIRDTDIALAIISQILLALGHAHQNGIVHRDIKPDNVMLSSQAGVKVIDFGVAHILTTTAKTQQGILIGTPRYMSFEQATGNPVDITSDLYSVAIVLYELLTEHIPFTGNDISIIHKHATEEVKPPTEYNPHIPRYIEDALMRAMEKDRSKRFQSAKEFADALGCPQDTTPLPDKLVNTIREYTPPLPDRATNYLAENSHSPIEILPKQQHTSTLHIESGTNQGRCIVLTDNLVLGRQNIDPNDHSISREHLRIEQTAHGLILHDISRHGTIINISTTSTHLRRGESYHLEPGAIIQVGQTILKYEEISRQ